MKGFQRALGGLYQSVLRAELTARYGVVFGEIVKGQAEIAGMPEGLLEEFSKRSVQVERAYQRLLADFYAREGRDPISKEDGAMRRQAAADTRGHKSGHGAGDLRSRWLAEAATVGVTAETLTDSINARGGQPAGGRAVGDGRRGDRRGRPSSGRRGIASTSCKPSATSLVHNRLWTARSGRTCSTR